MFKVIFTNGTTLYYQGNATLHDLAADVGERGQIVTFEWVDAKPRKPRAFDVSQVIFDPE